MKVAEQCTLQCLSNSGLKLETFLLYSDEHPQVDPHKRPLKPEKLHNYQIVRSDKRLCCGRLGFQRESKSFKL